MEEQTSWKGQTFTLLVFAGIVVLCSIFFILGMLVGRDQGQKIASKSVAPSADKVEAKPEPRDAKPDFTFYDSVKKEEPAATLQPPPAKLETPPPVETAKAGSRPEVPPPPVTSKPENVVNYQVGAVRKSADAEKLLAAVKKKGF